MTADHRLYLTESDWLPMVNLGDHRLFCHRIESGADAHHRIADSEIYLSNERENYCLSCALEKGLLTKHRPTLASMEPPTIDM